VTFLTEVGLEGRAAASKEGDEEEDNEDEKEGLGDAGSQTGYAIEAEGSRDDGDEEEDQGVPKHAANLNYFSADAAVRR
jgi:hypothetical protein